MTKDNINPDHYKVGGIETWDYLRAKMSPTQLAGFALGNVIKYISRADHKNKLEDLKESAWYLDKIIEEIEKGNKEPKASQSKVNKKQSVVFGMSPTTGSLYAYKDINQSNNKTSLPPLTDKRMEKMIRIYARLTDKPIISFNRINRMREAAESLIT